MSFDDFITLLCLAALCVVCWCILQIAKLADAVRARSLDIAIVASLALKISIVVWMVVA